MNKRYCSSCGYYRDEEGGKMINTANKNVRRWKCITCITNMSKRKYESKKHESISNIVAPHQAI
jgi:hypothetical protein